MTLRTKLVAALGLLSAIATLSLGAWTYGETQRNLLREINRSIDDASDAFSEGFQHDFNERLGRGGSGPTATELARIVSGGVPSPTPDGHDDDHLGLGRVGSLRPRRFDQVVVQVVDRDGIAQLITGSSPLPTVADNITRDTSAGYPHDYGNVTIDGERYRMLTAPIGNGYQIQIARSLVETDRVLDALRERTAFAIVLVSVVAAMVGWLIARQITQRLTHLTIAAEDVARTGRLDVTVPIHGHDEAGRLSVAFSGMLGALARSRDDQKRLVQDAGHELRTPLTSLRTNIATLRRHEHMDPTVRESVLNDLDSETKELTTLVNELVELATDQRADEPVETVNLADVARRIGARAERRTGRIINIDADGTTTAGQRAALERAVSNLVDNAIKFDPGGSAAIEVVIRNGRVEVNDRGPGIAVEDMPRIFDRFHRAVSSRSQPGSGLGLSIVHDVALRHGGTVFAVNRTGGGASIGFALPADFQTNSHPKTERRSTKPTMMDRSTASSASVTATTQPTNGVLPP